MKKVVIIGAGPVGNYLAFLLAKKFNVEVFEEHDKIGEPLQCAGLVSSEFKKIVKTEKFILNKIDKARVFTTKDYITIKLKPNYVIDRIKFDQFLYEKAKEKGAKFHLGKKLQIEDIKKIKADYIIGADGPNSKVASAFGMLGKREFFLGIQARVKMKNNNIIEFYPFVKDFAWVIPENNETARIGVASRKNAKDIFDKFIKRLDCEIIDKQAGLIPIYNPNQIVQKKNVYLVGDAACQVKATTGGGIIQGLIAAQNLAKAITQKKDYNKLCQKLRKELYYHLVIRKILDIISEKDLEHLIELASQEKIKKVLYNIERDHSSKLLFKVLIREPRFAYFMKYLNKIFINK